ncbi:MAG TPA: SHOCT domain-containing protein [Polyangiaceae bacterium]|nr:SHOCT domain-containing protein [Polyangiaceae bacterium]
MQPLTSNGEAAVQNLAQRYGVSVDAAKTLLFAVNAGGGSMAQFYHSELGGGGQWMRGGMTMVGDMFNSGLQATVAGLCSELSSLLSSQQVFQPIPQSSHGTSGFGNNWWPGNLGSPSSSGGQNDSRYAYFPQAQRLAIDRGGRVTVYNTLDHHIGGVQQQQGGASGSLSFSSQFGTFTVDSLPLADQPNNQDQIPDPPPFQNQPQQWQPPIPSYSQPQQNFPGGAPQTHDEILATLERLSGLHQKGILSEDEFRSKKAELLSRL